MVQMILQTSLYLRIEEKKNTEEERKEKKIKRTIRSIVCDDDGQSHEETVRNKFGEKKRIERGTWLYYIECRWREEK